MQGRTDRLTYRSVNVMSPEEAATKNLPSVYMLPGTDGAGDLVRDRGGGGEGGSGRGCGKTYLETVVEEGGRARCSTTETRRKRVEMDHIARLSVVPTQIFTC